MINTAGHCSVCHQNFMPNVYHTCGGTPSPCGPRCSQRTYYAPVGAGDGNTFVVNTAALETRIAELETVVQMIVNHWRKGEPVEGLEDIIDTAERCLRKRTTRT
jgi:hypothetical protein